MGATVHDQLVDIVTDALGCEAAAVTDHATASDLGADSLDMIEIVMRAEDECAVTIADDELVPFGDTLNSPATFGELVALVERKRVPA
ncbi:MAG: acyl carrier protein [Janthinobacterium lividum]